MPENIFSSESHHGVPFPDGFGCHPKFQSQVKSPYKVKEDEVVTGAEQHLRINVTT